MQMSKDNQDMENIRKRHTAKEEEIKGFFWTNGVLFENREEEDISIDELKELIRKVEEGK